LQDKDGSSDADLLKLLSYLLQCGGSGHGDKIVESLVQDQMEMGTLRPEEEPKQEPMGITLADALAMLGLQHAHVIHEADPDTKVATTLT